jgi:hypothetical protein
LLDQWALYAPGLRNPISNLPGAIGNLKFEISNFRLQLVPAAIGHSAIVAPYLHWGIRETYSEPRAVI